MMPLLLSATFFRNTNPYRTVESPIFIVGANRSGTTLLRLILNAHPRIGIPDEFIYLDASIADVPIDAWRAPGLSRAAYALFVDRFLENRKEVLSGVNLRALRDHILDGPRDLRRPFRCALRAWARRHDADRWGEKTPGNLFYADVLVDMFPDARFVYIVRDPRAGVASMQRVSFFSNDAVFNALSRRKYDIRGRAHLREAVPEAQRTRLRYEDLVRRPESEVRSLCAFLDEPYSARMLHFHREAGRYMKDDAKDDYNTQATHAITDERVDAWTDALSGRQVAVVEAICRPIMEEHAYERVGETLAPLHHAGVLVRQLYWRYQCFRHRDVPHYTVKHRLLARTRERLTDSLALSTSSSG
ncbi:sulfotransferase family protein [Longibacter sp.]|uniref:sulfotransferase family protein n=1 Tax=Longibacter sp. TaxID=2045415 RepID=UPI003EB9E328